MCGIVGAIRFNQQPVRADMVEQMANTLKHRGPDDAGVFVDGVVGLGHRYPSQLLPRTVEAGNAIRLSIPACYDRFFLLGKRFDEYVCPLRLIGFVTERVGAHLVEHDNEN